ncbi:hypothetical protein [Evansella clarkii]|uniref:hypothetical protein n=1 Tax=Evansella clarkii TaxID=79879 RepID=UPI0009982F53|nr:hypothetical protein [Evansella clarkii]
MAFRRKRIKDPNGNFREHPVTCSICKDKTAFHTMHGGHVGHYKNYGGKTCCDDCVVAVREEENKLHARDSGHMTEADWQTWGNKS